MIISTFLGNNGKKYELTRHNLPWIMLTYLSFYKNLRWSEKFKGEYSKFGKPETLLLKPCIFMNNSGESVAAAMSFFKLKPSDLLVIHDDLELPFGSVQLKKGGGAGGHNGLRSIIRQTGSPDFFRFRLGISRPPAGRDVSSWVLSRFSPDEEAMLPDYLGRAAELFEKVLKDGLTPGAKIKLFEPRD